MKCTAVGSRCCLIGCALFSLSLYLVLVMSLGLFIICVVLTAMIVLKNHFLKWVRSREIFATFSAVFFTGIPCPLWEKEIMKTVGVYFIQVKSGSCWMQPQKIWRTPWPWKKRGSTWQKEIKVDVWGRERSSCLSSFHVAHCDICISRK